MAAVQDSDSCLKAALQNLEGADGGDKKFTEDKSEGHDDGGQTLSLAEETEDCKVEPLNPLRVDTVIEKVFRCLPVQDLAQCRAVCRQWKDIGAPILIDRIEKVQIRLGSCSEHGTLDINSFLKMQRKNGNFYFANFYFEELSMRTPKARELFDLCGTEMTKLKLDLRADDLLTPFWLADILTRKAPFLESLDLDYLPEKVRMGRLYSPALGVPEWELRSFTLSQSCHPVDYSSAFLKDFFAACGKLSSITLVDFQEEDQLKVLRAFSRYGKLPNLRELNLSMLRKKSLRYLIEHYGSAPLEKFSAERGWRGDLYRDLLGTLVAQHQATLETLAFNFETARKARMTLPALKKLTSLSVACWDSRREPVVRFGAWDYGNQFPNLVTLKLVGPGPYRSGQTLFDLDEVFPHSGAPCTSLRNLDLHLALTPAALKRVGAWFPKLQKLWLMPQPAQVLAQLWGTWATIRTLGIELRGKEEEGKEVEPGAPKYNLDSIFTGIEPAALETLDVSALAGMSELEVDSMRTFPSINTWTELNHLIVYDAGHRSPSDTQDELGPHYVQLSDTTALSTLSKMHSVVVLHLGIGTHKISSEAKAKLCSRMGLQETENHGTDKIELVRYDWQKHQPLCPVGFYMSLPDYS